MESGKKNYLAALSVCAGQTCRRIPNSVSKLLKYLQEFQIYFLQKFSALFKTRECIGNTPGGGGGQKFIRGGSQEGEGKRGEVRRGERDSGE